AEKNRLDELAIRDKLKEEAMEKGIEKGKIAIDQTMLSKNFSVDMISEVTGLSLEQINALK
ncbi:MAG: hypothetical protein MI674_01715, partial [Cytophagales bacterium]|nr:hypothetical protein [Cytophagales bacterium]